MQIASASLRALIVGLCVSCLFWVAGCGSPPQDESRPSMFFENSTRRDPTALERRQTLFANRCTAFFVRNSGGLNLVMSARHCFGGAITNWCQTDGAVRDNDGNEGRCKRIVAADAAHDIALFEAELPYVADQERGLELAAYSPAERSRLTMVGFPVDRYRHGALTTTENCWILQADTPSPHGGALSDRSARHNCTTYGGNSGGPMLAEGTAIVVGLPFTYAPGDYVDRSSTDLSTASHMAKMVDFTTVHRAELEALGVSIEDTAPSLGSL